MSKLSELKSVEVPVTEWLTKMGWTYQSPDQLKEHTRPITNPIIEPILIKKIEEINQVDNNVAKLILENLTMELNKPNPLLANEIFLNKLYKGVTLSIDGDDKDFFFIDFDNIWNNSFIVTNQYITKGYKEIKTDIMLLVNGIPLVPIEAKQRARKGTNWLEGVKQFSTYQMRNEKLFISHAFGVACNGKLTKYGIPGASSSYFSEFKSDVLDTDFDNPIFRASDLCTTVKKDGIWCFDVERFPNGELLERMKFGIIGLLQPARVLDILKNFIVFERDDGKVIKKVARYQQLRAANKIVQRVEQKSSDRGVIWHTQGSGKSLTMLYTAYKLRHSPRLKDPTVYIVVDRKDLKEQIDGTFENCEFPNSRTVFGINDLKKIIDDKPAGVFITTIQKFRELGNRRDSRDNVIILIDEAHRTQYGDFQVELQNVLPNAFRFAFTGTPIPKTHREFGVIEDKEVKEFYLDRYGIVDAIEDGATVPIRYTYGPQEFFLNKEALKKGYEEITAELTEEEKKAVEKRVSPWKIFLKNSDRISTLSKDIANDFKEVVEPQGFKAQLVACDKEACVLYYDELRKYFEKDEIAIVFSEGSYDDEEHYALYKDHYRSDKDRKALIKKFKQKDSDLKIFIVCNMLLTGFDAPIEQTMYLDSPIRDHTLLQAVARTNRPYDNDKSKLKKEFGRIVDYVGVFENYNEALNYDPKDIGEFEDVETLAKTFPDILDKAFEPFKEIKLEDTYECSIAIVRVLSSLDQGKFEDSYREVVSLYESISPHPSLRESKEKYLWLNLIYEMYLEEFKRNSDFDAEIYAAKTRKLIAENTKLIDYKGHLPEIIIDEKYIDNLKSSKLSPSDKAEKIIRDIETIIKNGEVSTSVYTEYQDRLDQLVKQKKDHSEQIEEILRSLEGLFSEVNDIANLPKKMGFDDKCSFDIYLDIKAAIGDGKEALIREFSKEITKFIQNKIYVGWYESDKQINAFTLDIELLADDDKYVELNLADDQELIDSIMQKIIKYYKLG